MFNLYCTKSAKPVVCYASLSTCALLQRCTFNRVEVSAVWCFLMQSIHKSTPHWAESMLLLKWSFFSGSYNNTACTENMLLFLYYLLSQNAGAFKNQYMCNFIADLTVCKPGGFHLPKILSACSFDTLTPFASNFLTVLKAYRADSWV